MWTILIPFFESFEWCARVFYERLRVIMTNTSRKLIGEDSSVPSDLLLIVGKLCLLVMQKLISKKFESKFICSPNQKRLMFSLVSKEGFYMINEIVIVLSQTCISCHVTMEKVLRRVVGTIFAISCLIITPKWKTMSWCRSMINMIRFLKLKNEKL